MTQRTKKQSTKVQPKVEKLQPNLTMSDYMADIKVRYQIHQQEVKSLIEDIKVGYKVVRPQIQRGYDYLVTQYRRIRPVTID